MYRIRVLVLLLLAGLLLAAPAAHGAAGNVVLSQAFAGGGNSGAPFANDFVELFNGGTAAVDLSTWTVQYASAAGTTWQMTALSGSVAPGHYYLVQLASGAAGSALPPPDASGTSNLAVSGGKVALVHDATALACGGSAGSCSANASVEDLLGYGSAADYEGAGPAAALSSTTSAQRADGGCADTNVNSADFSAELPAPRNSSSPAASCGGGGGGGGGTPGSVSQEAAVDIDIQPVLSIALERPTISFGSAVPGQTPAAISERVTVESSNQAGYALTIHRSAFVPADLPLGIASTSPAGGQLGGALSAGAFAPIPIAPAPDLVVGTASAPSPSGGDVWPTRIGFTAPLPAVSAGRYTASVIYTVIGR